MPLKPRGFILLALGVLLALALAVGGLALTVWLRYRSMERSLSEKLDQYWLSIASPGREAYLLSDDELFEVPYLASTLSAQALPTRLYDLEDRLIGEYISEKGVYVSDPSELPEFLKKALIASEDGTFYAHHGANYGAMAKALVDNLVSVRRRPGRSTLTQQLAKMLFTTRKRSYGRKLFELFCAKKIESKFTKDQILLMYLNYAYFGHGCYGVESASRFYFGKPARALELGEAAMLVALIPSPSKYSPLLNDELARARHRTVLRRMAALGFIPSTAVERYSEEFWRALKPRLTTPEVSFWRMKVNEAPYFVEEVRRLLAKHFPKERILKGGLVVKTTLDLSLQKALERSLKEGLAEENRLWRGKRPDGSDPVQGAAAAVRASDGAVLALAGGAGFQFNSQLDRAVDIHRPIGSSVKPFIYAKAFELGRFKPDDRILDEPLSLRVGGGRVWTPHNYGDKYYGEVTLSTAVHKSLNSVAIKVLQAVGPGPVVELLCAASGAGRELVPRNLSLALGTADLSPLQLASSYALFANGGMGVTPYLIRSLSDRDGRPVEAPGLSTGSAAGVRLLSEEAAAMTVEAMKGVLAQGGSAYEAARRTGLDVPAAGKTGTTNDYRDAWFAGVTADFAAAVWLGHDDMRVALGPGRAGGTSAAPVWMRFVKEYYRARPTRDIATPAPKS
ncbi:MAG TPA: hypothetical protein DCM05_00825 [Elusimicrobia bacterium]|nr:hypothetical protein [Elusimicrobiota bacterium]